MDLARFYQLSQGKQELRKEKGKERESGVWKEGRKRKNIVGGRGNT